MTVRTVLSSETKDWTDDQLEALFTNSIDGIKWLQANYYDHPDSQMPENQALSLTQLSIICASSTLFHALEVICQSPLSDDDQTP